MDRAVVFGTKGWGFESLPRRFKIKNDGESVLIFNFAFLILN